MLFQYRWTAELGPIACLRFQNAEYKIRCIYLNPCQLHKRPWAVLAGVYTALVQISVSRATYRSWLCYFAFTPSACPHGHVGRVGNQSHTLPEDLPTDISPATCSLPRVLNIQHLPSMKPFEVTTAQIERPKRHRGSDLQQFICSLVTDQESCFSAALDLKKTHP